MSDDPSTTESGPPDPESAQQDQRGRRGTRGSRAWFTLVGFSLVLVLLVVFIAQNTQRVEVTFLGWTGHAPLAVALLIAAAAAAVVTIIAEALRMLARRRRLRRSKAHRR
jgi:uncharacterized integral membrane protein